MLSRTAIIGDVELRQLSTFVAVAEEGSFTRAADRLHVVQSAVSAGIRNLERELDAQLFDRSTHSVELTDAGRALLPEARATLTAAAVARDAVDAVRGGVRGTVTLGTMQAQGMRSIDVAGLLADFRSEHPLVQVRVRHAAGGSGEMVAQVREGRLDLAFVAIPGVSVPPGVELRPLASEPISVAVAAGHPLAARASLRLSDLVDEEMVEFPEGWGIRASNDQAFSAAGLSRRIAYEVNDTASVLDFVSHGLAIGMVPGSMAESVAGIQVIAIEGEAPQFRTGVASPTNRRLTAAAEALLDALTSRLTADHQFR